MSFDRSDDRIISIHSPPEEAAFSSSCSSAVKQVRLLRAGNMALRRRTSELDFGRITTSMR
jgi:hypothetical protein